MASRTFFYPQHQLPSTPAHQHWLVNSGIDIPDLNANLDIVRFYASALESPLPTESDHKQFVEFWVSEEQFQTAMAALYQHFGFEDPSVEVDGTFEQGVWRYVLDTQRLNEATGSTWSDWDAWVMALDEAMPGMVDYCRAISYPVFNWKKSIWEAGSLVRRNHGYRLRPIPALQGSTQFDEFVQKLDAKPSLLDAADHWAIRISRSTFLDDMLRAGSIDKNGNLLDVDDIIRDRDAVALYLGNQPKSPESIAFDVKEWGFWVFPLMKRSFELRNASPVIIQAPFFYSVPLPCDPSTMQAGLEVSLKTREHRVIIGSLLSHKALMTAYTDTSAPLPNSSFQAALDAEVQLHTRGLEESREVVKNLTDELLDFVKNEATTESRPVITPIDHHIFLSTNATRRLTMRSAMKDDSRDRSTKPMSEEVTDEVAGSGVAAIPELELDLEHDDLPSITDALNDRDGRSGRADYGVMQACWSAALSDDIKNIQQSRGPELYRLFVAIRLMMYRSAKGYDGERRCGRDVKWFGSMVSGKSKEKLEREGGVALSEVRSFGRKMIMEGYWALGKLPHLYAKELPDSIAKGFQSDIAIWLACTFISSQPFLYTTVVDHVLDTATAGASAQGCSEEGLGVLSSMAMYANGISIAATIGMRTMNPKDPLLARRWIRALLYPQAALQGWPFGAGPRLPCLACTGNHAKLQDLDASSHPSGLTGTLQSVRLRDRLSVSVFATRRGINADHTRSLGRTTFFDCLVVLINLVYQPQFVVCFLYHATLIHFEDKAARGKSTIFLTDHGFVSASG